MHDLVVGALQEGRVDRAERLHPLGRHAGGERHRMLLGDADIEEAIRIFLGELLQPGAGRHRRGDRHDPRVGIGGCQQALGEDRGVGRRSRRRLGLLAGDDVELRYRVELVARRLGGRIATTLLGNHVQQHRALLVRLAQVAQDRQQVVHVVAVDRADIVEAELLEQRAAGQDAAGELVGPLGGALDRLRQAPGDPSREVAQVEERARRHQPRQVVAHRAHRRRDRHLVVVQHHD